MILKSEKLVCTGKEKRNGVKDGKAWNSNDLSFDDNGVRLTIAFVPESVWTKAEQGKSYIIKYYVSPSGRPQINDITNV